MKKIQHAIISGSTRDNSQSFKVANYIAQALEQHVAADEVNIVDLAANTFPLWDETVKEHGADWHSGWSKISKKLHQSDAIIVVVPEWNGMVPPQLSNFFQLCSHKELMHKPGLIVSVSAGEGGFYPIAELRMGSFKNTKICYLPEHIIIRNVGKVLNDFNIVADEKDQYIRDRLNHVLALLHLYAESFKLIRNHDIVKNDKYPRGM